MITMKKMVITKRRTAKKLKMIKDMSRNKNKKFNKDNNLNIKMIRGNENKQFKRTLFQATNRRIRMYLIKEIILNNSNSNQLLLSKVIIPQPLVLPLNLISKLNCKRCSTNLSYYILQKSKY